MICSNCRRETDAARFCIHCGARLGRHTGPGPQPPSGSDASDDEALLASINQEIASTSFMANEIGENPSSLSQESRRLAIQEVDIWQADLLLAAAQLHRGQGHWAEALAAARRTLGLRPDDPEAKYICGLAYQGMGQADDAANCFLGAIDIRPGWLEPRACLADLYESNGRPSQAIRELKDYARVTSDITLRERVRRRAADLSQTLRQYGLPRHVEGASPQTDTADRLAFAVRSVEELHRKGVLSNDEANQLQQQYAQRLDAAGLGQVLPATPPSRPTEPAGPRQQERPVHGEPPSAWGLASFLTALLSERNLHAMLYVGAMLLLVSSVAITAISWDQVDSPTEWGIRQAVLTFAGVVFFWIGHIIRTKSPAGRSAGALLTVGALWVPIAVGHIVYRFIEAQGEPLIPGLTVALDLPTAGWLIISAAGVPAYALLAIRFQLISMAAAAGLALAASVGLALSLAGLPEGWDLALMTALGPIYVSAAHWAGSRDFSAMAEGLSWLAHLGVPATFLALIAIQPEGNSALAFTAWSAVALYAASRFYRKAPGYDYALGLAVPAALLLTLSTVSSVQLAWYSPVLAVMGALYLGYTRLNPERPDLFPSFGNVARLWPITASPYYVVGLGLILVGLLWTPMWAGDQWAARIVTLYGAAATLGACYRFLRPVTPAALAYLSVGLFAAAFGATIVQTSLSLEWYGLAFALLGAAYIFLGGRIFPQSLATGAGLRGFLLQPHMLGGWVLSAVALAWAPMWADGADASRIATLYTSVVIYGASAYYLRPRAWFLVLLAGALLPVAYLMTILPSSLAPTWFGLILVPFAPVYWLAAEVLRDYPRLSVPRFRPDRAGARLIIDSPAGPLYLLAVVLSLAVPVLSVFEPWVLAASLFIAAGAFLWPAWVYQRSVWLLPSLTAAQLGVGTVVYLSVPLEWYGMAFAMLGAAYIFLGGRFIPQSMAAAATRRGYLLQPHLLIGWLLSAVAVVWTPMWADGVDTSRIPTLYASVVIYAASAYFLRPRAWFLVYFAGALLPLAYLMTVLPYGMAPTWFGLLLVPFAPVYWLTAEVLRDYPKLSTPRFRHDRAGARLIIDSPATPLYLLAVGLSVVVPLLSVFQPWVLASSLIIATASFLWPAWVHRRSFWMFPALAAAYLGAAQVLYLATDGSWNLTGAYFGGVVVVVWSVAAWVASQRKNETVEAFRSSPLAALAGFWTVPLWCLGVIGLVFSLASSMLEPQTGLAMALVYGILTGTLAVLLRGRLFAAASTLLILGVGLPTGLWAAGVQLVHAPLYATGVALAIGVLFYLAGRWEKPTVGERIWAVWSQPVRFSTLALAAAGFAVSLAHAGVTYEPGAGSDHFRWLAVVLAAAGLNVIWWAFVERSLRLTYLGVGMVQVSYLVLLGVFNIGQPLYYVVPTGLFLMATAYAEQRWGDRSAARALEKGGLALLLGVTLGLSISEAWQFYGEDSHFYYGVWLFFSSLLIFLWGGIAHWKWTFLAGVAVFVANFFTLLSLPVQLAGTSISWWWIVLAVAVLLIGAAAVLEMRREQVIAISKEALEGLESWS